MARNVLKLRIARVTELYKAFEVYHDELEILDPNDAHHSTFAMIQEQFYNLAGKVENLVGASGQSEPSTSRSSSGTHSESTAALTTFRKIKLPEAPLPTFDGKYEEWLSFKNAFQTMIGSQPDLAAADKLRYLKSALVGGAANKVKILDNTDANYAEAWELLERSYEVKRVLISRHLSLVLNLTSVERESTSELTKLADDMQQHIAALESLGVSIGQEMVTHLVETKLPRNTLDKWEAALDRDEVPTTDKLYDFIYKTAVCASKRERIRAVDSDRRREDIPNKRRRIASHVFMTSSGTNCIVYRNKQHPLFRCDKFKQLSVSRRIEIVKNAKLCYNCMRSHRGSNCKYTGCTICQKRHNSLLHLDRHPTQPDVTKTETKKDQTA